MDTTQKSTGVKIKVPWVSRYSYSVTVLAYIVSQIFTTLPLAFALLFTTWQTVQDNLLDQPWMNLALTGVGALGILFVLGIFMKKRHYSFALLKMRRSLPVKTFGLVVAVYALYLIASVIVTAIAQLLFSGFDPSQEQVVGYTDAYGWQLLLAFAGLVIIPPIAEEMLFRGFLYQGLRDHWQKNSTLWWGLVLALVTLSIINPVAGLIVALMTVLSVAVGRKHSALASALMTSTLFGLVHMQWNVAVDTFVFSFALIYVFEKSQNLWASIMLHALKNGIAFVGLFILG